MAGVALRLQGARCCPIRRTTSALRPVCRIFSRPRCSTSYMSRTGTHGRHLARRAVPLCFGPWRLHRPNGYLACPSAGRATVSRGVVNCPKLAWAMRLPEKQQAPLSSGAQEIVSLVAVSVVKTLRILAVLNGCFNIKGFGSVSLGPNLI